ncbi:MAG: FAD-dependent oxidoreductase [Syntrophobacterales bacterium]|jgi:NADPH-dependent 2,4-dienoyl-CoA reductase/sulfur reductase-like enzyme/nitrite reductase/ring-hydroxylating ferredoxin subunit
MSKEIIIAKVNDLEDGVMKEVEVEGLKILLTRLDGAFHAIGGECAHYGGPLAEGVLSGVHVTCPWHQARFHVKTGEVTDPPALDSMARFETKVQGDKVILVLPEKAAGTVPPSMIQRDDQADSRLFVILGGGAAGNAAAQKLRQVGYQGRILLISQETRLPYDRPNLSKGYLAGEAEADALPLRSETFYREADIELQLGHRVSQVNPANKTIIFRYDETLTYDSLLLATGGQAKKLAVSGAELANVFTLRSADDCDNIMRAAAQASRAVVVGASFIGMETAAALKKRGLGVTVVGRGPVPLERTLGPEIGAMLQKIQEENGVSFKLGRKVARLEGEERVREVVLDTGESLPADLVLVGIGVHPATDYLREVPLNPDGSVTVDKYLSVAEGLYAAGDIARFPDWRTGEHIRIEHWQVAELHGFTAALNMSGQPTEFLGVPFFWTEQFEPYLYYVGHVTDWDEIIWHGTAAIRKFVAFYVKNDRVLAAAGCEHDHGMAYIAELMRTGSLPTPAELRAGNTDLFDHLK